jgi:hypothetical protein
MRPLLLFRNYALAKPKEIVTSTCDVRHRNSLPWNGLKIGRGLQGSVAMENRNAGKMHNAAHSLQSTAFTFPSKSKTPARASQTGVRNQDFECF